MISFIIICIVSYLIIVIRQSKEILFLDADEYP